MFVELMSAMASPTNPLLVAEKIFISQSFSSKYEFTTSPFIPLKKIVSTVQSFSVTLPLITLVLPEPPTPKSANLLSVAVITTLFATAKVFISPFSISLLPSLPLPYTPPFTYK